LSIFATEKEIPQSRKGRDVALRHILGLKKVFFNIFSSKTIEIQDESI
jgi:hypothetical protein